MDKDNERLQSELQEKIKKDDLPDWEPPHRHDDLPDIRIVRLPPLDPLTPKIPDMDPDIDGDISFWDRDMHLDQADELKTKEIDRPFYRHDVFDNYYKRLQEFRDNDMLEEDDEQVMQDDSEFEMER